MSWAGERWEGFFIDLTKKPHDYTPPLAWGRVLVRECPTCNAPTHRIQTAWSGPGGDFCAVKEALFLPPPSRREYHSRSGAHYVVSDFCTPVVARQLRVVPRAVWKDILVMQGGYSRLADFVSDLPFVHEVSLVAEWVDGVDLLEYQCSRCYALELIEHAFTLSGKRYAFRPVSSAPRVYLEFQPGVRAECVPAGQSPTVLPGVTFDRDVSLVWRKYSWGVLGSVRVSRNELRVICLDCDDSIVLRDSCMPYVEFVIF